MSPIYSAFDMSAWTTHRLGEYFDIKHGFAFKGEHFTDSGEFVLLTPGNFNEAGGLKLKGDKEKFYDGDFPSDFLLRKGEIIIAMTDLTQNAPILGSAAIIPEDGRFLHNQRLGKVVGLDEDRLLPEFLLYLMNTRSVRGQIKGSATGSTVKHTAPSRILEVEVEVPDLPTQRRIAEILSAYDELIANNQRRIAILEEMARALYREWFVRYNAPGVRIPAGSQLPEGWEVCRLSDRFKTVLGGTPTRRNVSYWSSGTIPWINSGKINDLRVTEATEYITEEALRSSSTKMMPRCTTVIAITGATLGQVSYLEIDCCANQSVVGVIDESGLANEWIYLMMLDQIHGIVQHATGGAQQHINKEVVNSTSILFPGEDVLVRFKAVVSPVFEQINVLLRQSDNLRRTRDLLLPRLMSGREELSPIQEHVEAE